MAKRTQRRRRPDTETLVKLIQAKHGNLTDVARACGVVRRTVEYWVAKNEELRQAKEDADESLVDFAESQAYLRIRGIPITKVNPLTGKEELVGWENEPSDNLIKYILSTKGKKRGYIVKQELEIEGEVTINFSTDD